MSKANSSRFVVVPSFGGHEQPVMEILTFSSNPVGEFAL